MERSRHWRGSACRAGLAGLALLLLSACGKKGAPQPPQPRGPLAPTSVTVRQTGTRVEVRFRISETRGPKPGQQPVQAELMRVTYPPGVQPAPDARVFYRRGQRVALAEGTPLPPGGPGVLADRTLNALADGGIGHTLRYGVRVYDRRGRPSPLVMTNDLVPLAPPGAPRNLRAEPTADGIRLSWEAPPGGDELEFNVYRSIVGAEYPLSPLNTEPLISPEYLDREIVSGETYGYLVRVALAKGRPYREGESSRPTTVLAEDRYAPEAPRGLIGVQEGRAVRLFWDPNRERDLAGYRVYRRIGSGPWRQLEPATLEQPLFLDAGVEPGQVLTYRVTAIDRASPPNEGLPAETPQILVADEPSDSRDDSP